MARPRRSPLHPRSSTGGPPHACLTEDGRPPRSGQAAHSRSSGARARAGATESQHTRVHASSVHARAPFTDTSDVRLERNYDRARTNRPRPLTLAVTLMSRQVTRAPHQLPLSPPPGAALPIKRRALRYAAPHYRGRKRPARSLPLYPLKPFCMRDYA